MEDAPARRRARHHATLSIGLLVAAAFLLRLGPGRGALQETVLPWTLVLLGAYAAVAILWWIVVAWRHRRPDPWAYDPDLDGPIAQEIEGRTYAPPPSRRR